MHTNINKKTHSGFSLVEIMVSIFIFVLIMGATASLFASAISTKREASSTQQDYEKAQFAMNLMAKTLRTSTIVDPSASTITNAVHLFDYSQESCLRYTFTGTNTLTVQGDASATTLADCESASFGSVEQMTDVYIQGQFSVTPTSASQAGLATISMRVCTDPVCDVLTDVARMQTSVSLRDYSELN